MLRGLGGYRVLRCLASGAQGTTYLALDTRLQRRVCIKLYHLNGNLAARRHAVREAWNLARVSSPRVLGIHDVLAHGPRLALVTRYHPGCDLQALLASGPALPPGNVLSIVSDIAAALAALRRARIIHGDLKAANILVDPQGRAVLADFGTAICRGERPYGFSREALTPEHSRDAVPDLRSDFFALGLLLFRMLEGRHPFYQDGALDPAALRRGMSRPPVLHCQVSDEAKTALQDLFLNLLAADVDQRPQGTFELRERLRVLRSLLPAPETISDRVMHGGRIEREPGALLQLPPRLVHPPLWRHAQAAVRRYWSRGSIGARVLLGVGVLLPVLFAVLTVLRPGPCIAIAEPRINAPASVAAALPDSQQLRQTLTRLLKNRAASATVLGLGPASDSRKTLATSGVRDVCVAQRSLGLQIECASMICALRMRSRSPLGQRRQELTLPAAAGALRFEQALEQLLEPHIEFLLR